MDLGGRPLLYHVFERILASTGVDCLVLATCGGNENRPIIDLAESMDIGVFIGSEENVLERFYLASEHFGGDYIMRVTGDNPFTDHILASRIVEVALKSDADICHFTNLPLGTGVGMVRKKALNAAYRHSDRPYHFEHVTPYIREHPEIFNIVLQEASIDNPFNNLRLTVDTCEDYKLAQILYGHCYRGSPFPLSEVIDFLKNNPQLVEINSGVVQRPMTHSSLPCQE